MLYVEKTKDKYKINIGDLVLYNGLICLVADISTLQEDSRVDLTFPYTIINLETGLPVNDWKSLEDLNKSSSIELLAKNEEVVVNY